MTERLPDIEPDARDLVAAVRVFVDDIGRDILRLQMQGGDAEKGVYAVAVLEALWPRKIGPLVGVFFSLKRADRGADRDVEMFVESAYAFDPQRVPKTSGRMKIAGLLTGVVERRPMHTQRRSRYH